MRTLIAAAIGLGALTGSVAAQPAPPQFPDMTFFVSSKGAPNGADLGGLEGADRICQTLAAAAGAGAKTWRAYLSTQAIGGAEAVNARDRIGKGPWQNARNVAIATDLESLHNANTLNLDNSLTETGRKVPGVGFLGNAHDILTGSTADGMALPADKDATCRNWTSGGEGSAMVGHSDRLGLSDTEAARSWNSAHASRGCSIPALVSTGGAGLLYCFAAD